MAKKSSASKDNKQAKSPAPAAVTLPCGCFQQVTAQPNQVFLRLLVKPGAKQNGVTHVNDEDVGVQIAAPPKDGEANDEVREYMADVLQLRRSQVTLAQGHKSRNKTILIDEITLQPQEKGKTSVFELHQRLLNAMKE